MRWSRFRRHQIRAAEQERALAPASKMKEAAVLEESARMLRTRIVSLRPARQVEACRLLRATMSILAPSCPARYSSSMISSSVRLLTLIRMRASSPSAAARRTSRIAVQQALP